MRGGGAAGDGIMVGSRGTRQRCPGWQVRGPSRGGRDWAGKLPITPVNRPICARFGVVARWDFQERARLILPNEDRGCKRFLRNLAAHSWSPPDKCLGTVSGKSDSNEKNK